MPDPVRRNRVRVALDIAKALVPATDFFTSETPLMPSGRHAQFECGLFNNAVLDALTDITSIKLEVGPLTVNGVIDLVAAKVMSKTVSAASFNMALTATQWAQGFDYHVKFDFLDTETGLAVDSLNYRDYGAVVTAQTTSGPITCGVFTLRAIKDGGLVVLNPPPVGDPAYVRADDYAADKEGFIKRVNPNGTSIILTNNLGYTVELRATPDSAQPQLEIIQAGPPA
jgi:hypothetical protein